LGKRATDRSKQTENSRDEDGSTTAEVVIAGIAEPAPHKGRTDVGASVDNANDEVVSPTIWSSLGLPLTDTKFNGERQVGSVGSGLIPTPMMVSYVCDSDVGETY
jgi:hypothetical protein